MITRILPILLIIFAIGIFVGYINPVYTKSIMPLQTQVKQYKNTLLAAEDFNRKEAQLATERNAIPADAVARLLAFLPDGVDNIQLILDLNALASRTGVKLSDFNIKSSEDSGSGNGPSPLESGGATTDHIEITLRATGTYDAFRTFLSSVERSLRPLDLVQITITDSATGVYTYDMTYRIYWLH
jgi:hypothetical protein